MDVGYVRVSTVDQKKDRQLSDLELEKIFEDKAAGNKKRPALEECLVFLRDGDTLHVHSIDRLARSLAELQLLVSELNGRGIEVVFHRENLTFSGKIQGDPLSKLMLQMMGAFAEFERSLIRERQAEGIAKAKEKGVYKGRQRSLVDSQIIEIKKRKEAGERVADLAREFDVSRATIYNCLGEI